MKRLLLGMLVFGASACGDPLKLVELVSGPRVLGARVEVDGAPERASPQPGESATVRWLVATPELDPALGWAFQACVAENPGGALAQCADAPFGSVIQPDPVPGVPTLAFTVPAEPIADHLAVSGIVCPGGSPSVNADGTASCSAADGTEVGLDFAMGSADAQNLNPSFGADALFLDAEPWAEGTDCATLPQVAPRSRHALTVALDASDRDALPQETSVDPPFEELQLSHFTTAGELERAFTMLSAEDTNLARTISWQAPAREGLVRFFFVVRDLRGGSDWAERAVCVAP